MSAGSTTPKAIGLRPGPEKENPDQEIQGRGGALPQKHRWGWYHSRKCGHRAGEETPSQPALGTRRDRALGQRNAAHRPHTETQLGVGSWEGRLPV